VWLEINILYSVRCIFLSLSSCIYCEARTNELGCDEFSVSFTFTREPREETWTVLVLVWTVNPVFPNQLIYSKVRTKFLYSEILLTRLEAR
jgi:hypothetical protein